MTTQELRELDAWIAEHVMGWTDIIPWRKHGPRAMGRNPNTLVPAGGYSYLPEYTADSSGSMDVLKKCAEKCGVRICEYRDRTPNVWDIYSTDGRTAGSQAETLELAICLFAKQLFSKTTK